MTDTVRDQRLTDLVNFALDKKPVEFQQAFDDVVTDRISVAVDARKQEIARGIFGGPQEVETIEAPPQEEEETDGEES